MKHVITVGIAIIVSVTVFIAGIHVPLSLFEGAPSFGATSITTILGTDTLSSSRSVINSNFSSLDAGKIDNASTSIKAITTLPSLASAAVLATVGTITSGVWNGTAVTADYINKTTAYTWTAQHNFTGTGNGIFATSASSTYATSTNHWITNLTFTGITSSLLKTSSTGLVTSATAGSDYTYTSTSSVAQVNSSGTATTTITVPIPANTLSSGRIMTITAFTGCQDPGPMGFGYDVGSGTATTTLVDFTTNGGCNLGKADKLEATIFARSATQQTFVARVTGSTVLGPSSGSGVTQSSTSTPTLTLSNQNYLAIRFNTKDAATQASFYGFSIFIQ